MNTDKPCQTTSSEKREVFILLLIAFLLRLTWVLAVQNELLGDAPWFHYTAKGLLHDHKFQYQGIPTAFFPVGYPAFLSFVYWIATPDPLAAKVANVFLSTLICFLTFLITRQIFGVSLSRFAIYIMTFFPSQIFFSSLVITEVLFTACLILCLFLLLSQRGDDGNRWILFLTGAVLGIACLVRSIPVFLPAILFVYTIWIKRLTILESAKRTMFVVFGMVLVLTPWSVRNTLLFDQFVLVSTNGGVNFWLGQVQGRFIEAPDRFTANWLRPAKSPNEEVIAEKMAYREAFEYLKENPATPFIHLPRKFMKFYYADIDGLLHNSGLPRIFSYSEVLPVVNQLEIPAHRYVKLFLFLLSQLYYTLIFTAFVAGVVFAFKRKPDPRFWLMLLFICAWTLFHTLFFFPLGRYRFPIAPLMVIIASYGISQLNVWRKSKQMERKPVFL